MASTIANTPVIPTIRIFTEEPDSSFTGMVPARLSHIGVMDNKTMCACFKFLNETSVKSAYLQKIQEKTMEKNLEKPLEKTLVKILENDELCCITYDKGVIKAIAVYQGWVDKFVKKNISTFIVSPGGEEFKAKKNVGIQKISKESYNTMSRMCVPLIRARICD